MAPDVRGGEPIQIFDLNWLIPGYAGDNFATGKVTFAQSQLAAGPARQIPILPHLFGNRLPRYTINYQIPAFEASSAAMTRSHQASNSGSGR